MATTVAAPLEPQQPSISAIGRVIGVFFSPKPTFADIARKPSWVAPILIVTIFSLGVCYFMTQKIDWAGYMRTKAEKSSRFADLSEEQKQRQIAVQTKFVVPSTYVFGLLGPVVIALVLGGVYLGAFNLFAGAGVKFKQAFAIVSHGLIPGVIAAVLTMITLAIKPFGQATPETMLASHLGAILGPDAPPWELSLLSSFDIFWIWQIVLFGIGYAAVNPKKLTTGKSIGIVAGVWLAWVVLKVGASFIFS
jgi:hypothetical protein